MFTVKRKTFKVWQIVCVVLLGLACYWNSFSAPFIFDDLENIVEDPEITGSHGLWSILLHGGPRRVVDFTFALNFKLHGLEVAGYHVTNLFFHLSTAVVLYLFCSALIETLEGADHVSAPVPKSADHHYLIRFVPVAVSLLFVCHPLQTQSVTYIVQRYAAIVTFFYLLALLAYVKGRISYKNRGVNRGVVFWGLILTVSALLGIFSKQIFFSLPLMIIALELCFFNGRIFKQILALYGVAGSLSFLVFILPKLFNESFSSVLLQLDHATTEDLFTSRTTYFITQLRVIVTYLRLLVFPLRQGLDYHYPYYSSLLDLEVIASLVLHIIIISLAAYLYVRTRKQEIHDNIYCLKRLIIFGIAWFYVALSITSSIIPITDVIMEHRVYLPSIGFFIAAAAGFQVLALKFENGRRYRWIFLVAICIALSILTVRRNWVWGDELRFWNYEASISPNDGRVISNLGSAYLNEEEYEKALRCFVDAIYLDPRLRDAWISLGHTLNEMDFARDRFATGDEFLTPDDKVDLRWTNRFYSNAYNNMGLANEFVGRPEEAFKWYQKSLTLDNNFDLALYNLGLLATKYGLTEVRDEVMIKLKNSNSILYNRIQRN